MKHINQPQRRNAPDRGCTRTSAQRADGIERSTLAEGHACISWQVAQEWLNVALRKAAVPLTAEQARSDLDAVLLPLLTVMPSPRLHHRTLDLQASCN